MLLVADLLISSRISIGDARIASKVSSAKTSIPLR